MKGAKHIPEIKDTKNGVGNVHPIGNNPKKLPEVGQKSRKMSKLSVFISEFDANNITKETMREFVGYLSTSDKKILTANQGQYKMYCELYPLFENFNQGAIEMVIKEMGLTYKTLIGNRVPMFKKAIELNIDYTNFKAFNTLDKANKAVAKGLASVSDKGTVIDDNQAIETAKSTAKALRLANNEQLFKNKSFVDMMKFAKEQGITEEMIIQAVKSYKAPMVA